VLFALISLVAIGLGLRALRTATTSTADGQATPVDYMREAGRALVSGLGVTAIALLGIQLVPVSRTNPPVQTPIQWDSPQTESLAHRACMNCHSNETTWPWYAYIAPTSWLNTIHVHDARAGMNLSELNSMPAFQRRMIANNMATRIRMGTMPPSDYLALHPEARLTDAEKQQLIQGLQNSLPNQ
jgi:hypothetical protein